MKKASEIIRTKITELEARAKTWKINSESDIYTKKERALYAEWYRADLSTLTEMKNLLEAVEYNEAH